MLKVVKERNTLVKYINEIFKVSAGIERIIYIIFLFLILSHITSCLWYFLAKIEDFAPETWVVRHQLQDASISEVRTFNKLNF